MSSASSTKVFNESVEYAQVGTVHSGAAFCIMKAPIESVRNFVSMG